MDDLKKRIEIYFDRLWPICRSITGPGYRQSLDILSEIMPTERLCFESGRKVFDWTVPKEWAIQDAYFVDPAGVKCANFKVNNLHVVNYSSPVSGFFSLDELKPHLHYLPDQPDAIPYVTSYYKDDWGFCLTFREFRGLPEGSYRVLIDSQLRPGYLEVGEAVLKGESEKEILFSANLCHPSLANNELSGPLLMAFLYEKIKKIPSRRFTYRFVITPETIGSICYLTARGEHLKKNMIAGYVITCVGDSGQFTYKFSRDGNSLADRVAKLVLRDVGEHKLVPFFPAGGSDERQYCSPGFNLPVGSLMRTMYGKYSQYHTSLDNKNYISFNSLIDTLRVYESLVVAIEANRLWKGTVLCCEPNLGLRGLYPLLSSSQSMDKRLTSMLWLLNLADGTHDLLAIAEQSMLPLTILVDAAEDLFKAGLLEKASN